MERPHERRRLPPLNALRAFEAAARHLNFSRAADELSVTPGAVSQQIQNLEDYVGAALFKRPRRRCPPCAKPSTGWPRPPPC
jgi:LysR family glycine cleavage system transcriptional activator